MIQICLLLVNRQDCICHKLKAKLEQEPDLQVMVITDIGQTAVKRLMQLQPDLVLIDAQTSGIDPISAIRSICQQLATTKAITVSDKPKTVAQNFTRLTNREREVLNLIKVGSTNREIAAQLCISEGTVKNYVTQLLNHFDLRNRSQLAIYANPGFNAES